MNSNRPSTVSSILSNFASLLGTEIEDNRLIIPKMFGTGYCIGYVFNENIRLIISNFELYEDLPVNNPDTGTNKRMIFFKFQNIFPRLTLVPAEPQAVETPSVLIGTSRINTDGVIRIHSNTATVNIEVDAGYLSGLFDLSTQSPVLQSLLQNTQPLLFEQLLYPSLQNIVNEIVNEQLNKTFKLFYLRIKAEELICRLLMELQKREEKQLYPLNGHDAQVIAKIKEHMLGQLDTSPVISELAAQANMSPSKLKRLFKQIYGDSIFSYYQKFRINEAARLIKEERLSVSAAGYRMGFTNLSHFARVFKEQLGVKPKGYSKE